VSEEKSTLASGDESSEPIDQESLGLLLKTPQPEPTPTPVLHTVVAGENLLGIAAEYGVKADLIAKANDLWDPNRLRIGQVLLIPPPQRFAYPVGKETPGELRLWWPLQGEITTYFGEKESYYIGGAHTGIDIAANVGDPVRAAAAGKVVVAWKRTDNVGWHIVLDHGNGYSTLYGHLSKFLVEEGDLVEQGQVIGAAGDTGFSFGPHLHFVLRQWGTPIDPLEHLPD
jgi:LysM repeat protein